MELKHKFRKAVAQKMEMPGDTFPPLQLPWPNGVFFFLMFELKGLRLRKLHFHERQGENLLELRRNRGCDLQKSKGEIQ